MPRNRVLQKITRTPKLIDIRRQNAVHFAGAFGPTTKSATGGDRRLRSKLIDAFELFGAYRGVKEKHTKISFDLLRRMARICEPMSAIVQLRCNQVGAFAKRPRFENDKGFRVTTRDPEQKVKKAEKKEIRRLEDFFLNTGLEPPQFYKRDNFDFLLRKIARDSLVLDAYAIEKVPGRNPRKAPISEIWSVDAATIRLCEMEKYAAQIYKGDEGAIAYVQEIDGKVMAEYTLAELAYGVRNPQTDITTNGYGMAELEYAINTITGILNASQYNRSYFSNNSTPRGIINIVGSYGDEEFEAFKRAWRAQLEGVINSWRTPIMAMDQGQGVQWIPLDQKGNRDMEFHLWLDFQINTLSSLYGVNPAELGFKGYQPSGPSLSEGSNQDQVDQGEDKGLLPLLINILNTLNSEVLWVMNPEFSVEWTGLPSDDKNDKQQYMMNWLQAGVMTANEVRTQLDMPHVDGEWGDAPANPQLLQVYMADKNAEMQENMPPQYGPATEGGPQMPPGKLGAGPPGASGGPPNKPQGQQTPTAPQAAQAAPGAAAKPATFGKPAGQAPQAGKGPGRPFGKSLGEDLEIVVEFE